MFNEAEEERNWRLYVGDMLEFDDDVIWDIIHTDITELLPALRNLLNTVNKS